VPPSSDPYDATVHFPVDEAVVSDAIDGDVIYDDDVGDDGDVVADCEDVVIRAVFVVVVAVVVAAAAASYSG